MFNTRLLLYITSEDRQTVLSPVDFLQQHTSLDLPSLPDDADDPDYQPKTGCFSTKEQLLTGTTSPSALFGNAGSLTMWSVCVKCPTPSVVAISQSLVVLLAVVTFFSFTIPLRMVLGNLVRLSPSLPAEMTTSAPPKPASNVGIHMLQWLWIALYSAAHIGNHWLGRSYQHWNIAAGHKAVDITMIMNANFWGWEKEKNQALGKKINNV